MMSRLNTPRARGGDEARFIAAHLLGDLPRPRRHRLGLCPLIYERCAERADVYRQMTDWDSAPPPAPAPPLPQRRIDPALMSRPVGCEKSLAFRHLVYKTFLSMCDLSERDANEAAQACGVTPATVRDNGAKSAPTSDAARMLYADDLAWRFGYDLAGVAGFYYEPLDCAYLAYARLACPPGKEHWYEHLRDGYDTAYLGTWNTNLPRRAILKPYYAAGTARIAGLLVFDHPRALPKLFSSRGLPFGTEAERPPRGADLALDARDDGRLRDRIRRS